ncbi:MAG: hydroxyethylthiazole kinase [Clostridia bacterium]
MLKEMLKNVYENHPLIHNITNYVTVNDCANILLACGASPIMSDEALEVEEITKICSGLNLNIGTLNERVLASMLIAGKHANALNHPVLLDPVGAGASSLRTNSAIKIMKKIKLSVIRGNISEIKTLIDGNGRTRGVDANEDDGISALNDGISSFKAFAESTGTIIVVTGATDIITDGKISYAVTNGVPMMSSITGSGCMLSALITAFISANRENMCSAALAAVVMMGIAGEKAFAKLQQIGGGNSTYRNLMIDEIYNMTPDSLEKGARYARR